MAKCVGSSFTQRVAQELQSVLELTSTTSPTLSTLDCIQAFAERAAETCWLMAISDPPLTLDLQSIGQKVAYNQFKFDTLDGFVKAEEECVIVLPSVHKQATAKEGGHLGELVVKANVLPVTYEFS